MTVEVTTKKQIIISLALIMFILSAAGVIMILSGIDSRFLKITFIGLFSLTVSLLILVSVLVPKDPEK